MSKKQKEIRVAVIPADPDSPLEIKTIPNTLKAMQSLVGGYVEFVPLNPPGNRHIKDFMVVNEEGIGEQLPLNMRATAFALWSRAIDPNGMIFGTAFLVGDADRNGDTTSVSDQICYDLTRIAMMYDEMKKDPLVVKQAEIPNHTVYNPHNLPSL